jgi:hypothetical protein
VNIPWAMTSGSPTFVANRSSQWIGLRSNDAPAYWTSVARSTWIVLLGRVWPASTSATVSTSAITRLLG